jgi:ribosome-associated heat shock protein Hsp15
MPNEAPADRVRIDKWLWAARFFKTRSLATEAVAGGKVDVNGERAKPAKLIAPGDSVRLRATPYEYRLTVRGLAERRGSASLAQSLYDETPDSIATRERLSEQHRLGRAGLPYEEPGRPSKKERRQIADLVDRQRRD